MAVREKLIYAIGLEVDAAKNGLKDFRKAVQDADTTTGKLKAGAQSAFASVKANAGIAALAVGGTMVAAGAKALTQFTDLGIEVEKFSKATALSTEEASRWIEVAGDLGITTEQIQGGFVKLEKAIASGVPAVKDLGIELQKNADGSANVSATMLEAISALEGIKDPTEKAKAATELFGRGFADMAELVTGDASKIKAALGEVSDAKILDQAEIDKAKRNRENLDRLKDTIEDLALSLGETLGPALEGAADGLASLNTVMSTLKIDKLIALTGKFDDLGTTIGHFFGDLAYGPDVRKANEAIVNAFKDSEKAASEFDTTLLDGLDTFADVRQTVLDLTGSQHAANRVALDWLQSQRDVGAAVSETGEVAETAASRWAGLAIPLEAASGAFATMPGVAFDTSVAIEAMAEADAEAADAAERHTKFIEEQRDATDQLREAEERRAALVNDSLGGAIRLAQKQRDARDSLWKYNETVKEHNEAAPEFKLNQDQMAALVGETALEQLAAGEAAAQYEVDQLKALGATVSVKDEQRILREELQKVADSLTGPVKDAVLGAIADFDALARPRTIPLNVHVTQSGANIANLPGQFNTGGGLRAAFGAEGAIVNRPTLALIGEAGPEALVPLNRTPGNSPLPGGMGAGGNQYTINLYGGEATPQGVVDAIKKWERLNGTAWRS
jgi:ribosomal protein L11